MADSVRPMAGPRTFQWNAGAWLGTSLGSTAWLLPTTGILVANGQPKLASVSAVCFLFINAVAICLWMRRDRVLPFRAYMILLGALAVLTPVVWFSISLAGSADALAHMNWPESNVAGMGALLVAPAIMLLFYHMEYRRSGQAPST